MPYEDDSTKNGTEKTTLITPTIDDDQSSSNNKSHRYKYVTIAAAVSVLGLVVTGTSSSSVGSLLLRQDNADADADADAATAGKSVPHTSSPPILICTKDMKSCNNHCIPVSNPCTPVIPIRPLPPDPILNGCCLTCLNVDRRTTHYYDCNKYCDAKCKCERCQTKHGELCCSGTYLEWDFHCCPNSF